MELMRLRGGGSCEKGKRTLVNGWPGAVTRYPSRPWK